MTIRKVVDNTEGGLPMSRIFNWFTDKRGGWLYIPFRDLEDVGMTPFNFTAFSYIDARGVYLEEEMDAEVFVEVYERKTGFRVILNEIYEESSEVRQKQRNKIDAAQRYWEERERPTLRIRAVRGPRNTLDVLEER